MANQKPFHRPTHEQDPKNTNKATSDPRDKSGDLLSSGILKCVLALVFFVEVQEEQRDRTLAWAVQRMYVHRIHNVRSLLLHTKFCRMPPQQYPKFQGGKKKGKMKEV